MRFLGVFLVLILSLVGCARVAQIRQPSFKNIEVNSSKDLSVLQAFLAIQNSQNDKALDIFYTLYKQNSNKVYLKEALKIAFLNHDARLDELINLAKQEKIDDSDVKRVIICYEISNSHFDEAKKNALELIKKEPNNTANHSILGYIYAVTNELKRALNEFQIAYKLDSSEENLLKLADLLDSKLDRRRESVRYMQEWVDENSCTKQVCIALLKSYASDGNTQKMIETYTKLYEVYKEKIFLQNALGLYILRKDFFGARSFLEKYNFDDLALMEVYASQKEYDKAYELAKKLYDVSRNPEFMARMAIYKYEKAGKSISKFELDQVAKMFENSVYKLNGELYYNYYGYMLIDHDIDVKKGLELVLKAHELDPNSPFIIDSVAWGYFKLGNCSEAKLWMDKILGDTEFMRSSEAILHKKLIEKCAVKK